MSHHAWPSYMYPQGLVALVLLEGRQEYKKEKEARQPEYVLRLFPSFAVFSSPCWHAVVLGLQVHATMLG